MNEVELFVRWSNRAWEWLEETVADVTGAQANWWPPGTANSIGANYLHVVVNTDVEINRLIFDRPPLVETQWHGDVGQGVAYDPERFDRWDRHRDIDWDKLRPYGRAVHAGFIESLDDLTPERLDQPVDMSRAGLGLWEGRDLPTTENLGSW